MSGHADEHDEHDPEDRRSLVERFGDELLAAAERELEAERQRGGPRRRTSCSAARNGAR